MKPPAPFLSRLSKTVEPFINPILASCLLLAGLFLLGKINYLVFHTLAEIFGIVIACTAFVLTWNTRRYLQNGSLLFMGISLFFVAGFNILHLMTFPGIGVFGDDANRLSTQFWLATRLTQAGSMVLAPFFLRRKIKPLSLFAAFSITSGLLLMTIYPLNIFPVSSTEGPGDGRNMMIIASELIIIALFILAGVFLYRIRSAFDRAVWILLMLYLAGNVLSEIFFVSYVRANDFINLLGHYYYILSFYMVYRAIIETGFRKPQQVLFYELTQSEKALRASEASERQRRAELEAIMDAVPAFVVVTKDPKAEVVTGNRTAVNLLRVQAEANLSRTREEDGMSHPSYRVFRDGQELTRADHPLEITVSTGRSLHDFEETILFDDGEQIHLLGNTAPLFDDTGHIIGAIAAFIDITDRKRAEHEVQEYANQLERSNRELQEFAFVASHDLQEPLRKIQAFSERLKAHLQDHLDDEARDYLDRLNNAGQRMRTMIEDLLSLSRITTHGRPFQQVDLAQVMKNVISDLETRLLRTHGQVEVQSLPVVEGDPTQLHQLFLNLVNNALKFHRDGVAPLVKIYSENASDALMQTIYVEDNGIGFEEQYSERIFQPFQRLHGIGKYEGSGIGLAICRKIVDRHTGSIDAHSIPGQGSTFIVRLPAHQVKIVV